MKHLHFPRNLFNITQHRDVCHYGGWWWLVKSFTPPNQNTVLESEMVLKGIMISEGFLEKEKCDLVEIEAIEEKAIIVTIKAHAKSKWILFRSALSTPV